MLLIDASSRSEHTYAGEMSKTYRLLQIAREIFDTESALACDVLDLSRLAFEYGRQIHPCKACFSASPTLCHYSLTNVEECLPADGAQLLATTDPLTAWLQFPTGLPTEQFEIVERLHTPQHRR